MKIRVSTTRMELLRLKRQLSLAVRGHRLLKDKQDELVRQFFLRQEEYRSHLGALDAALRQAAFTWSLLEGGSSRAARHQACRSAGDGPRLTTAKVRVLNLLIPVSRWESARPVPLHGLLECAGPLEDVLTDHLRLMPMLVRTAELEKVMTSLLAEVEVTKRRVNALEYNLIPSLRSSIHEITAKLSELELSSLTRLMRVKEIISKDEETAHSSPREPGGGAARG